jgi:hypothetical protein
VLQKTPHSAKIKISNAKETIYDCSNVPLSSPLERKINLATDGLQQRYSNLLIRVSEENALVVADFILKMNTEINLSDSHRINILNILSTLSHFYDNKKPFKEMMRQDILAFLDSFRKTESSDPLHKWIGTYNVYLSLIIKFFKWLYYPEIEPDSS